MKKRSKILLLIFLVIASGLGLALKWPKSEIENKNVKKLVFEEDQKGVYFTGGPWGKKKIEGVDIESFQGLGNVYAKDKHRVYCCLIDCSDVVGADWETFEVIKEGIYAKDKNGVYKDCGRLSGVDPTSFKPLNINYYQDKNGVYCGAVTIKNADLNSFKVLDDIYAKDKNQVYYDGINIIEADPRSFVVLDNIYSKDSKSVYVFGKLVSGIEAKSFEVLKSGYGKDETSVYSLDKKISGADPKTFQILNEFYQKDKSSIYREGRKVKDVDYDSFEVFENNSNFAKDKNYIYRYGERSVFDVKTFKILDNFYYKDKSGVYFNDVKIMGADSETFESLGDGKAKDKNGNWVMGKRI